MSLLERFPTIFANTGDHPGEAASPLTVSPGFAYPSDAYIEATFFSPAPQCAHCNDTGWVDCDDLVDYGSTTVTMTTQEPCTFCDLADSDDFRRSLEVH